MVRSKLKSEQTITCPKEYPTAFPMELGGHNKSRPNGSELPCPRSRFQQFPTDFESIKTLAKERNFDHKLKLNV